MKILVVSDYVASQLYHPSIRQRFGDVNLVLSCGDLPYYYLEYLISTLDTPLYYVRGNHQNQVEFGAEGARESPWGAIDLNQRCLSINETLLAGIEGCLVYNYGPVQYTQREMWMKVFALAPRLMVNYLRYRRFLDIFVTHAPPWQIQDASDQAHRGIKAFLWVDRVFRPIYHLHGHTHVYSQQTITETVLGSTKIMNVYGYRVVSI